MHSSPPRLWDGIGGQCLMEMLAEKPKPPRGGRPRARIRRGAWWVTCSTQPSSSMSRWRSSSRSRPCSFRCTSSCRPRRCRTCRSSRPWPRPWRSAQPRERDKSCQPTKAREKERSCSILSNDPAELGGCNVDGNNERTTMQRHRWTPRPGRLRAVHTVPRQGAFGRPTPLRQEARTAGVLYKFQRH
jgi:hypothetical protein